MNIIPPNFLSVRLTDADKANYAKVQEHVARKVGMQLPAADIYRLAIVALAEQYGLKGMQ
jgi:hypothetical protein